ncbi:hypothetical protein O0235_06285 [Tepidiforma flava]|uniref:Glutamine amidotransferase domain-containing protein n=1 Tax=Tepidiforma flava TaxID=3004094 RepID=A0ABY7M9E6_9CHLR|nr:hypothetical protein [Tepidiforma flava]WBL37171.1 hypothetical protein O0235_06285 [Tepidiforma flava]
MRPSDLTYPETRELLRRLGAEIVPFSPLADARLPRADALYLGGGYMYLRSCTPRRWRRTGRCGRRCGASRGRSWPSAAATSYLARGITARRAAA